MSDWLFDLGNSRLKCAPMDAAGGIGAVVAVAHDGVAFETQAFEALPATIGRAWLASVASAPLREALHAALRARGAVLHEARTLARCGGVAIAYDTPAQLGVDRFLALLAAHVRGGDRLVVGVGTALTIDLLDAGGRHHGGRIAPSPALMRDSLHRRAAQLPATGGTYAPLATQTDDALASGCIGAAVALVEASLSDAQGSLDGAAVSVLLHGGGASELAPFFGAAERAPDLVLEGLARWARADPGR
jgi:type III pantothenate kinase